MVQIHNPCITHASLQWLFPDFDFIKSLFTMYKGCFIKRCVSWNYGIQSESCFLNILWIVFYSHSIASRSYRPFSPQYLQACWLPQLLNFCLFWKIPIVVLVSSTFTGCKPTFSLCSLSDRLIFYTNYQKSCWKIAALCIYMQGGYKIF